MFALPSSSVFVAGLVSHLWQTTLFVGIVAALILAMGNSRARVRHAMWFAASIKFAVPFSILVAIGDSVDWPGTQPTVEQGLGVAIAEFMAGPALVPYTELTPSLFVWSIGFVWLTGFMTILLAWFRTWRRARRAVQLATIPTDQPRDSLKATRGFAEVRMSTDATTPGVFGLFRHILLLPADIGTRLTDDELAAVIAHEAAHVRRCDNLTSAFHTMVTAVFWFHPFVWWIGRRLTTERERACDETTLAQGFAAKVFGEGLLKVCRSAVGTPLECVSGIYSSDLKKRMEGIMAYSQIRNLDPVLRLAIGVFAIASVLGPVAVGMSAQDARIREFERWLAQEVVYIIEDIERNAFESLGTLEEKEHFIGQFWARRDPVPGNVENEFRSEHYRRIVVANERFAHDETAGWQTDRGLTYIVYGPPAAIEAGVSGAGRPTSFAFESWRYDYIEGLGEDVELTFVDANQTGEFLRVD